MKYSNNVKGFTLIELMIVVAIVGIIAAITYPSYQQQVQRTNRTDATANMLALAQNLERFFTETGSYSNFAIPAAAQTSPRNSANPKYSIRFSDGSTTATNANTYTLQAFPVVGSSQVNDTTCARLDLNQIGIRCAAGGVHCSNGNAVDQAAVENCW